MEQVKLSNYTPVTNEKFRNKEVIVDIDFSRSGSGELLFEKCRFIFEATGALKFQDCIIQNCTFEGMHNLHSSKTNAGTIEIISCKKFQNNYFDGQFRKIRIEDSVVSDLRDESTATTYFIQRTEVSDFIIKGVCESLTTNKVSFLSSKNKDSTWDKKIIKAASCFDTIFDNVKINPFYLATKCKDKSSLDLSRATLIDHWSRLRKKYAGLSPFIIFFLTFLFFLPLFTHSFFLLTLSKIEAHNYPIKNIPLWEALLFGDKHGFGAVVYSILTIVLLIYNIGRLYMTISIAKLREEEIFLKDSNFNLVSMHPEKYEIQLKLDKWLSIMFLISIGYTLLKFVDTLMIAVPAFASLPSACYEDFPGRCLTALACV